MNTSRLERWCDKTMSVMREQQLEACQDRLSRCPGAGIFGELCQDEVEKLFYFSFYAQEKRAPAPTRQELCEKVLTHVSQEACFLSPREDELVKRMLMNGGQAYLSDWDEISAAEGLISRLWCALEVTEEDHAVLRLEESLFGLITQAMLSEKYARIREKIFSFDATLHSLLYLSGFLHAGVPAAHLKAQLQEDGDGNTDLYIARYLKTAFDYVQTGQGEILLLHPGLADPDHLIHTLSQLQPPETHLTREMMLGGMNGILPEEVASCEAMRGALIGAVRPEYGEDEALEDLRMMAKQGARLSEMREVLESMLCVLPTPRMIDALTQLHLQTVRWMGMPSAVLN
ncbi:MAG: hypothetical protein IJ189_02680 [Clostridia bacterium]|nr:hypothetical protein [Clostridia bacterium]